MIYTVLNTASAPRVFYDSRNQEITLDPGALKYADIDNGTAERLLSRGDLVLKPASFERRAPLPAAPPQVQTKPAMCVTGHFGIGDNLHQRAVMRVLLKTYDVWLYTCHFNLYYDLITQGLKLVMRPTSLHAQAKTMAREHAQFAAAQFPPAPTTARQVRIGYPKTLIDQHGSILEAMFGCVDLKMPAVPDFSLPIKPEWRRQLREKYLSTWDTGGKPLLVHRPVTVRQEWDGRSRNPDPLAYDALFKSIRDQFFVVSIADLATGREWIDGPQQDANVKLHAGELAFEEMAALFSEADLVFCNAGFAPVLAQAVGAPVIVVYGGRESYRTTQRAGAHLAPTLPIDVIKPCDCHSAHHPCDKRIDMPRALARVKEFVATDRRRSTLVFGTFYVDSPDRDNLTDLWKKLHLALNASSCDFLAVDSQSPISKFADWHPYDGKRHRRMYFNFPDNIGHLSRARTTAGKDGWGRAFCKGLEIACELGYEYVAHIEGDSLLRLKVADVVRQMKDDGTECASTNVRGMKHQELETQWIETGLMFFSTDYLKRSDFVRRYDWPNRRVAPTPERYIRLEILNKGCDHLRIMPWKALRADKNTITNDTIVGLDLDWITHQHDSSQQDVYRKFVEAALFRSVPDIGIADIGMEQPKLPQPQRLNKLNLGCGTNKLPGWENHDADVDITKPLPWPDASVSHISIEHCVEHVPHKAAIEFFKEAHRVLAPGGVLRVTVPSLEQIAACDEADYHKFTMKWQKVGPTKRGAMHAIIYAHGHEMIWNAQLMRDVLYFAGFDSVKQCEPGQSEDPVLRGVEGHGKVIGEKFNRIESCTHEARKAGQLLFRSDIPAANTGIETVAVVIGGAECWQEDLEKARKLLGGQRIKFFFINDQIKTFAEPGVAVTLHPDKLNGHFAWLLVRRKAGLPEPDQIWAHRKHAAVTHDTASKDWGGSSGLFAVQVARREGYRHIIGCGIPMTVDGSHYIRRQKWQSAIAFRSGWMNCKNEIAPYFRSMSGWTAEQFGSPTEDWLTE
jgi:Methyltransferase domain